MKLTEIHTENITNEIIKTVLFNTPKTYYQEAGCLIIFGCHIKELLTERLNHAIKILKTKKIKKVLLTGGIGVNGNFNESKYMKDILLKNGIEEDKILIEDKSTTTEENIINSIEILKNNNLIENKTIIVLSSQAHLRRIKMELEKQLKDYDYKLIYEYPKVSLISYENIINNNELRNLVVNQIKKMITLIKKGNIDDEEI